MSANAAPLPCAAGAGGGACGSSEKPGAPLDPTAGPTVGGLGVCSDNSADGLSETVTGRDWIGTGADSAAAGGAAGGWVGTEAEGIVTGMAIVLEVILVGTDTGGAACCVGEEAMSAVEVRTGDGCAVTGCWGCVETGGCWDCDWTIGAGGDEGGDTSGGGSAGE